MKTLFIKTYGCQMNEYDSDKIALCLKPFGYQRSDVMDGADMIVLNTCHIRERATERVYTELGQIKKMKETRGTVVVVAGCVAQAEGELIFQRVPWIDVVVGPGSYHNLPEMLAKLARGNRNVWELNFNNDEKFDEVTKLVDTKSRAVANITIQEGCDKFCKFCCVPYTRGAEFSRPIEQVISEVNAAINGGAREVILLGQNVNAYCGLDANDSRSSLAQLIDRISHLQQLVRVRYTTSHPIDMTDDLIRAHALPKLAPMLHLPVQSGSSKVLKSMGRKHDVDFYLNVINGLRSVRPEIQFSSDFIVGYPGETDEDFRQTINLVREVGYVHGYSFKYSPRPGTPAAMLKPIDEHVQDQRLKELQALLTKQQQDFNRSCVGKTMTVLLERRGRHSGQLIGRTDYMQSVAVEVPDSFIGCAIQVRIEKLLTNSLVGTMCAVDVAA